MKFTLQHKDPSSRARAGELETDHGTIRTPIFMPVGTAATVKGIFHRDVRDEARAQEKSGTTTDTGGSESSSAARRLFL